jgi:hypothetical protein
MNEGEIALEEKTREEKCERKVWEI